MTQLHKNNGQEQTVIFLHIPKAAGSTFRQIIGRQYDPATIFILNVPDEETEAELKKLSIDQRKQLKVLGGHMPFGLHKLLPNPSTYITMLRSPADRIISYYYYVLRSPDNAHFNAITSQKMSLKDYVSSGVLMDNGQTRRLAGLIQIGCLGEPTKKDEIGFGQCSTEILDRAKKHLQEYFAVVGLLERFDETLLLMKKTFGWSPPFYVKTNITSNRPSKRDISEDTLNIVQKYTALDAELYRYVTELFEKQIERQGPSFQRELATFRLMNKFYGKIYRPGVKIKAMARTYASR